MATTPDVLVIGGGIIGLTSAYFLAKAGATVEVVDRGEIGREASWAGAGILPPGNPDRAATPYDRLRAASVSQFAAFSAELRELTGMDNGYRVCGGIEFLDPADRDCLDLWRAEGLTVEPLDLATLKRLEPHVTPPDLQAYLLPDCAQVRNPWHLRALIAACEKVGVRLCRHADIEGLCASKDRITSVEIIPAYSDGLASQFLFTIGAWANRFLQPLGHPLPVHPVRGQIVLFHPKRPLLDRVLMAGKRYLVPRADGRILAGSTEEPEAGFEKATTAEGVTELYQFACELVPDLRNAPIEATWAGLRPGSPDGIPFIGQVPGIKNAFAAVGHFRAGIQLSIGTAQIVRDLILGRTPSLPADAFRLDRVPDATAKPAFRS